MPLASRMLVLGTRRALSSRSYSAAGGRLNEIPAFWAAPGFPDARGTRLGEERRSCLHTAVALL